jgi:glycosyltransferase involved in cell wall biosynthesis
MRNEELQAIPNSSLPAPDSAETSPLLSVIMPAYNEESVIGEILRRVAAVELDKEIIVIDDCSEDRTLDVIGQFAGQNPHIPVTVLRHERNVGKTASVRDGLLAASGRVVVIQDADLEYDPGEFTQLIGPILDGRADAVYGARFMRGSNPGRGFTGKLHRLVNKLLTFASNLATGLHLSDMETCYKMVRRNLLRGIDIESTGFGFEVEITAKLARKGARIAELPISYRGRSYHAGKKITPWDGLAALWWIVRFALFS